MTQLQQDYPLGGNYNLAARTASGTIGSNAITHGSCVAAVAGGVAAGDYAIGAITLPAGGPWTIFKIWCSYAMTTQTAGESGGGYFLFSSASGDVRPNPAPSRFSAGLIPDFLGATLPSTMSPLQIYDVDWQAAGKAVIDCLFHIPFAVTVAPEIVIGMVYGPSRAQNVPTLFSDVVHLQNNAAAEFALGTITLAESARRITGVTAVLAQSTVITASESLIGFVRLASDDINMAPAQYPFSCSYSGGLGALIGNCATAPAIQIPLDIPVRGGARVDAFVDLNVGVTNNAEFEVYISYE